MSHEFKGTLVPVDCIRCHAIFGMTRDAHQEYLRNHKRYFCPYCGGGQHYVGKSDEEVLRELVKAQEGRLGKIEANLRSCKLEKGRSQKALAEARKEKGAVRRSLAATKGRVTRLRRQLEPVNADD